MLAAAATVVSSGVSTGVSVAISTGVGDAVAVALSVGVAVPGVDVTEDWVFEPPFFCWAVIVA